ncbi:MAG: hypothetical protein A3I01_01840 [Betaproteobacteria bacterium RIFCSPLOWO2_02_FULL_65_24]|nr:MAG: hypothetical protein A3I01_01840 [Betaproteobacteria bacterium RIFCSPLOWO2_02_FULL_65_24]
MAAPTVADPGNHVYARILTYRGAINTGDPWDVTGGGVKATASTSVTVTGVTTTVPDTLIVQAVARDNDSAAAAFSAQTNANLASITEQSDAGTNSGNGGGIGVWDGVMATAGPTGDTTATVTNSINAFLTIALKPGSITLGNGTDPANAAIGPGGAATMADAFTFQTASGTNVVTAVVVGLGAGAAAGLSLVEITDDAGTVVYGSVADPASDTPSITLSTNTLTATTTSTQYKIRVTPKTHANMPAPPGATYSVTAKIDSWTSTFSQAGSDTAGTTVSIDNLSPANVSAAACTAGTGEVALSWSNPADADFDSVLVLRRTAAVADTPVEGTTYSAGNTVGASTVACVSSSTSCTDTGLTVGTAYHYRIFARDSNGNYSATGVVPSGSPCTPAASFNVVETGGDPATGRIFTKIAGQDIAVDIVAIDGSGALLTGFNDAVAVELVDNSGGGACASLPLIKTLADQKFTGGDKGRHPLSSGQFEADAWRDVKFRIKYPSVSPTVTSCSSDNFAIRPLQFVSVQVQDADRTTAGTTNTLNNTSNPGTGTVHNAGRPVRIDATAQNGAGTPATTTLYVPDAGQPVAVLAQCGVAVVCPAAPGTLSLGTWSASSGVITTTTASYNDVGAFNLVLEDQSFASVDAGDGTATSVRYISSAALTVGRFVPDYFTLEAGSSITPRSDIGACSGSTFTYMDERMDLVFILTARAFGGAVTPSYAGTTLGALALNSPASYTFGAIDSAVPTPLSSRLDLTLISGVTATWSAGSASVTAPLALARAANPDGPYASLKLGIAPSDPDGVTLQSFNLDADNNGSPERAQIGGTTAVRFGMLKLDNAYGSELLPIRVPVRAMYWNGTTWQTNSADNCTSLPVNSLVLGNWKPAGFSTSMDSTHLPASPIVLSGGTATLTVTKPSPAAIGSVDLAINLGATAGDANCIGAGMTATGANQPWLRGNWCPAGYVKDPNARLTFGTSRSPFIFLREMY